MILLRYMMIIFTKLRACNHRFQIKTGRWNNSENVIALVMNFISLMYIHVFYKRQKWFFFGKVKALSKFIKKIKDLEPSVFHFF